jgi:ribosome maturation factor RimP
VDRPLTLPRHWRRNTGRLVQVKAGERLVTGRVTGADDTKVVLDVNGKSQEYPLDQLGPGRVQVEFARLAELDDEDFGEEFDLEDDE